MMNSEQATALAQSPHWETVCKELDSRIEAANFQLRTCVPEKLREIQMRIQIYEELKRLPQDVKDREE